MSDRITQIRALIAETKVTEEETELVDLSFTALVDGIKGYGFVDGGALYWAGRVDRGMVEFFSAALDRLEE